MRRQLAATTYHTLRWARDHVAPGVRSLLGVVLMLGGVLGFLPVLGFWMFPLGLGFVALDLPLTRQRMELWMESLARQAGLELTPVALPVEPAPSGPDHPTSSQ